MYICICLASCWAKMSLEVRRCIYKYIYKTCICLCRGTWMLSSFCHSRDAPWMPFLPQQHARGPLSGHCIGTDRGWVMGAVNQELSSRNCEKHTLVVLRLSKYPWKAFQVQSHSTVQWSAAADGIAKMLELYKELWSEEGRCMREDVDSGVSKFWASLGKETHFLTC